MKTHQIIIITGLSGSGKSTTLAAFEDCGFYCVDNMPVVLLPDFLELPLESESEIAGLVFVMDLREKTFLTGYAGVFAAARRKGHHLQLLYLEAEEDVLIQRYSQTRRHHPVAQGKSLLEGIRVEKQLLAEVRKVADLVIDTTRFNVHDLKSTVFSIAKKMTKFAPLRIHIQSFGFRYGIPLDADLMVDVRFLSNPYFVPELKEMDGESRQVRNYVLQNDPARLFLNQYMNLLDFLIPLYEKEGKAYLTIAVGCTGGRHRSVAVARALFEHIQHTGKQVEITHRDIQR
ncbi:MAG: glmZ(sRNA)-inactivating NTPase [Deltaproteobacteria bacterium SG8_13]|nr:MAG: glmZ(sRNA)-inactivating NTPase [Deltaproteobacteria bacterium SG8_13]